jgi:excisionase family DNA binding protein
MQRIYSSRDVGKMVGADPSSVNRWIDSGRLKAYRTPGGHRRVLHDDLLQFLGQWGIPVPDELRPAGLTMLIVDDDEQYLRALRKALMRSDKTLEIQTCTSGIEALILIGARRPDVVLLDVYMPGIDGVEVCTRLKNSDETQGVMVIANTGRPSSQLEKRVLEAGAAAFLTKPFKPSALLEIIKPGQAAAEST